MWEISSGAAVQACRESVRFIAEQVDILSINYSEALSLWSTNRLEDAIAAFSNWNLHLLYLRLGRDGVYLVKHGHGIFVPSVPYTHVVDVTGGGNASSAGALVGYCKGCTLEEIGAMGNVSASFCIEQWGVPQRINQSVREEAERRMDNIFMIR